MITIIIILSILTLILGFTTWNLYSQVSQLEEYAKKTNKREQKVLLEAENYYKIFKALFEEAYLNIQRVDKRGSFSSDDEVGFAFKVIFNSLKEVTDKIETLKIDDENEEEK